MVRRLHLTKKRAYFVTVSSSSPGAKTISPSHKNLKIVNILNIYPPCKKTSVKKYYLVSFIVLNIIV